MLQRILEQRRRSLGGFEVGRLLPYAGGRMVGPFIFFDHMGPVALPPGIPRSMDVLPHPHIGISTITYLLSGNIMHRDSVGSEQAIQPGAVNWMTAGKGITHSERLEHLRHDGGSLHGIQAWVALPERDEEIDPAFFHLGAEDLPCFAAGGAAARLLAGSAFSKRAGVKTYSPMFYMHWQLADGARAELPAGYPERAAFIAQGAVDVDGQVHGAGKLLIFERGQDAVLRAVGPTTLMALGGEPLGHRFIEWNFVSSSRERIEQAKADWRAGRMKLPDFDHDEFVPLPPDPPRAVRAT